MCKYAPCTCFTGFILIPEGAFWFKKTRSGPGGSKGTSHASIGATMFDQSW